MVNVVTNIPSPITKVYERRAINTTQGRRITKRLEDLGYTRTHTFSTGRKGGRFNLIEVTQPGWALLKQRGMAEPKSRTNGDWEHEVAAELLEVAGRKSGYAVSFEVDIGGLRLDVQWLNRKTGQRHFFNIGISRPRHEVDSVEKFFSLPASQNGSFTLVARDVRFAKQVRDILQRRDCQGQLSSRINIKLVADFILL